MTNKIYAGIGSRESPLNIQLLMHDIGEYLARKGYILRSGHAKGADIAFERGCDEVDRNLKEIFTAEDCTEEALEMGLRFHPKPKALKEEHIKRLMGRNCMILLGRDLMTPVQNVICYCIEDKVTGELKGGTGQGIRIARHYKIPYFNLYFEDVKKKFYDRIYYGK